jgi:hypothetical protein
MAAVLIGPTTKTTAAAKNFGSKNYENVGGKLSQVLREHRTNAINNSGSIQHAQK